MPSSKAGDETAQTPRAAFHPLGNTLLFLIGLGALATGLHRSVWPPLVPATAPEIFFLIAILSAFCLAEQKLLFVSVIKAVLQRIFGGSSGGEPPKSASGGNSPSSV